MTQATEFRQYAEEALRDSETQSGKEKQALIKLARLWSRAASLSTHRNQAPMASLLESEGPPLETAAPPKPSESSF